MNFTPDIQHLDSTDYSYRERAESSIKAKSLPNPRSGNTSGLAGIFFTALDTKPLINRTEKAFQTNSSEGKFHAISDLTAIPLKIYISVITAIKDLSNYLKAAESIISKIGIATMLTTLYTIFVVFSTIYLLVESIRTVVGLIKSHTFHRKERIDETLKLLKHLTLSSERGVEDVRRFVGENKNDLQEMLGDTSLFFWSNDPLEQVEQIKAMITRNKVAQLYNDYIGDAAEEKKKDYLARRIGSNTLTAFNKAAKHINVYENPDLNTLDKEELIDFNNRGQKILQLLERQRKKVLKIHSLSAVVLTLASLSLGLTTPASHFILPGIITAIGITGAVTSLARGFAQVTYVDHTGDGINLRLTIPKAFCAAEGETNFSIWKSLNTIKKIAYAFIAILTGGALVALDALLKSRFITNLRGAGDQFDQPNSSFKIDEMAIEHPYFI